MVVGIRWWRSSQRERGSAVVKLLGLLIPTESVVL